MNSFERFGCSRLGRWRTSRLRSEAACLSLPLPRVISSSAATAASLSRASSELVPSDAAFSVSALRAAARTKASSLCIRPKEACHRMRLVPGTARSASAAPAAAVA